MDRMKDLDVNTAIWCIFMSGTLQAAVQLGKDYTESLRSTNNQPKKSLRQLFQVTQKLITDQTATAKTYVFSDSVPCLGGVSTEPVKA